MRRQRTLDQFAIIKLAALRTRGWAAGHYDDLLALEGIELILVPAGSELWPKGPADAGRGELSLLPGSRRPVEIGEESGLCRALRGTHLTLLLVESSGEEEGECLLKLARLAREVRSLPVALLPAALYPPRRRQPAWLARLARTTCLLLVVPASPAPGPGWALGQAIRSLGWLINRPGLLNVDFADVRTILSTPGPAFISQGRATGPDAARQAAQQATQAGAAGLSMRQARGLLLHIRGGNDLTVHQVGQVANLCLNAAHRQAGLVLGTLAEESMAGEIGVTLVAAGLAA